ncbi:hypothetical protein CJ195_00540 [Bacillus sp. UMB0899]|uniref:hypothetical protein n=1 Tax=Metabacillus schmidteae TaxID=2730405 RepID=UPI000C80D300|nr:hypothetical protein [Metabacillus schmidteae]PMC40233.1 hypothetical protein CJ195_00540 [Bacillus sp. UMB0899]
MKKVLMVVGIGATASMLLSSKSNRIKLENSFRDWMRKIKPSSYAKNNNLPIEKGGNPHPQDLEDNKMVSEGAMYSVNFYNEKLQ